MVAAKELSHIGIKPSEPINLNSQEFNENKYAYYQWMREEAPVCKGKVTVFDAYLISRYEDCVNILKDPRVIRNRTRATGGGRMPFPTPKAVRVLLQSMIFEDEPEHRRLRTLVHKAFTPRSLSKLEERVEAITDELLDKAEKQGKVNLVEAYALPIPVTVIQEMMGVPDKDMDTFKKSLNSLVTGLGGLKMIRLMLWDIWRTIGFLRELVNHKRDNLGDDILSALIQAEAEGDKLSEDELVSMVFLIIGAGYETTAYLITNAVLTLLQHPEQLAKLRAQPELVDSAIEEVLRYNNPVQGTKPNFATEDISLHGVTIPKGSVIMPLLGAANHDPRVFENPEKFDIERSPNKHLGFGQGVHYCLGAPLARLETKIALNKLLARNPNLQLAVDTNTLNLQHMTLWHRFETLPVILG
jgi:cytochrome P450